MAAIGKRLSSVRATVMKGRRGKGREGSRDQKAETLSPGARTVKTVEEMYSKPNKHSLPVLPDSSLVIVTQKTLKMVRADCGGVQWVASKRRISHSSDAPRRSRPI